MCRETIFEELFQLRLECFLAGFPFLSAIQILPLVGQVTLDSCLGVRLVPVETVFVETWEWGKKTFR